MCSPIILHVMAKFMLFFFNFHNSLLSSVGYRLPKFLNKDLWLVYQVLKVPSNKPAYVPAILSMSSIQQKINAYNLEETARNMKTTKRSVWNIFRQAGLTSILTLRLEYPNLSCSPVMYPAACIKNHTILKNPPASINRRLTNISVNESVFNECSKWPTSYNMNKPGNNQ